MKSTIYGAPELSLSAVVAHTVNVCTVWGLFFLCTQHREECQDKRHVSFTLHMDAGQNDIHEF